MPKISEDEYETRRQNILNAARDRFATAGIHISVDEVCTTAGVSKGAFYGYFKSKDAVFEALATDHGEMLRLHDVPTDRAALLVLLIDRLGPNDPDYARLELDTWAYAMRGGPLRDAFARNETALRQLFLKAFERMQPSPRMGAERAASILQFALQGAFVHLALHGEAAIHEIERSLEEIIATLLDTAPHPADG